MTKRNSIRVIQYRDGNQIWHAQCLEYDIVVQAEDTGKLRTRLEVAVYGEAALSKELNGSEFAGIDPAPKMYEDLWKTINADDNMNSLKIGNNGIEAELRTVA